MKNDIHVNPIAQPGGQGKSAAFQIAFQYPDPAKAKSVTATLVQKFTDESFQQRLHEAAGKHDLTVVDSASLPVRPIFPDERVVELVGCLLGAAIPFAWRRRRRKSIAMWGFPVLVVVFGFAGLLAANIAFIVQDIFPYTYRSTATLFVQNGSPEQIRAIATDATSRSSLSTIINDPRLDLYKRPRKTLPLEDVIDNMKRDLAITPSGQYFTVSFEYSDRYKAQQTVSGVMNRLEESYQRTYGGLPDVPLDASPTTLKVLDEASMPVASISPDRYAIAMKGGLAGLLAAAAIATIRRRWKPEAELPVDAVNG
jgi:hypothetical protein